MGRDGLTRGRFFVELLAIATRVIRSISFNVFMVIVGFAIGFGTMQSINHMAWTRNPNYECVRTLENRLRQQRVLDEEIDRNIRELKISILGADKSVRSGK